MDEIRREQVGIDEFDRSQAAARDAVRATDNFVVMTKDGSRIKVIAMIEPDMQLDFAEAMIETGQRMLNDLS